MKAIGDRLREKRVESGISLEEAASDLKFRVSKIKKIEEGDFKSFNDVFSLKNFLKQYAKYLGLNGEEMIDDFNEFLFDYTSKIPTEDIVEASKLKKIEKAKKIIASPYTRESKSFFQKNALYFYLILMVLIALIIYFIVNIFGATGV